MILSGEIKIKDINGCVSNVWMKTAQLLNQRAVHADQSLTIAVGLLW